MQAAGRPPSHPPGTLVRVVPKASCDSFPELLVPAIFQLNAKCYPPYDANGLDERAPLIGRATGKVYEWAPERATLFGSYTYWSTWPSYGKGGYGVNLDPRDLPAARAQIAELDRDGFLDESTRAVAVNMAFYNRHTRVYIAVDVGVETSQPGLFVSFYHVRPIRLQVLEDTSTTAFCVVIVVGIVIFAASELWQFLRSLHSNYGRAYFSDAWTWIELAIIAIFIVIICYTADFVNESRYVRDALVADPVGRYIDFQQLRRVSEVLTDVVGINILLLILRSFKFLRLNSKLSIVWKTLSLAKLDLLSFISISVVVFAAYAFTGYVVFGYQVQRYRNFTASFASLFRFITGDSNYDEIQESSPFTGYVFYTTFVLFVALVLINIFIAIVNKFYEAASHAEKAMALQEDELLGEKRMWDFRRLLPSPLGEKYECFAKRDDEHPGGGSTPPRIALWIEKRKHQKEEKGCECIPKGALNYLLKGRDESVRFLLRTIEENGDLLLEAPSSDPESSGNAGNVRLKIREIGSNKCGRFILLDFKSSAAAQKLLNCAFLSVRMPAFGAWVKVIANIMMPEYTRYSRARAFLESGENQSWSLGGMWYRWFYRGILSEVEINKEIRNLAVEARQRRSNNLIGADEELLQSFRLEDFLQQLRLLDESLKQEGGTPNGQVRRLVESAVKLDILLNQLRENVHSRTVPQSSRLQEAHEAEQQPNIQASWSHASGQSVIDTARKQDEDREKARVTQFNDLYRKSVDEASNLQRGLMQLRLSRLERPLNRGTLRIDELFKRIRWHLSTMYGPGSYSDVVIKRGTVFHFCSFPEDCFEYLNEEEEIESYHPVSFDVSGYTDTSKDPQYKLKNIIEIIGLIIHDVWSKGKIDAGYTYGVNRNDDKAKGPLTHKLLVPYDDLVESEKAYDKNMAIQSLRLICGLGYSIEWPDDRPVPSHEQAKNQLKNLTRVENGQPIVYNYAHDCQYPPDAKKPADYYNLKTWPVHQRSSNDDADLRELEELMAEAVHDLWAKERRAEGVVFGPKSCPGETSHLLKPYGLMSARERQPDLDTVRSTLATIKALGYEIKLHSRTGVSGFTAKINPVTYVSKRLASYGGSKAAAANAGPPAPADLDPKYLNINV
eukprot:tig00020693_g13046.t1